MSGLNGCMILRFQSTPPVRKATKNTFCSLEGIRISIHASREEGDNAGFEEQDILKISIHASREEGDPPSPQLKPQVLTFQSTPPVRKATM